MSTPLILSLGIPTQHLYLSLYIFILYSTYINILYLLNLVTSDHILLARIGSHDYELLQGKLGNVLFIPGDTMFS